MEYSRLLYEIKIKQDAKQAIILQKFFKTGKGEYGEGDIFLGLKMGELRALAKKYQELKFPEIKKLLSSKIHEYRMIALLILILQFEKKKCSEIFKKKIYNFYLANREFVNNWDLVDISAPKIIGAFMLDKPKERKILYKLAKSKNLWDKRISIISSYTFIKNNQITDTLEISTLLLSDPNDLIHKAAGWMLREVGKKNEKVLKQFLIKNYQKIPRTALRYAIERFDSKERMKFLKNNH